MLQNGQETALEAQEGGLWQCPDFFVEKNSLSLMLWSTAETLGISWT
jgi:hypothetical protein